jgi:hypothetical protein
VDRYFHRIWGGGRTDRGEGWGSVQDQVGGGRGKGVDSLSSFPAPKSVLKKL